MNELPPELNRIVQGGRRGLAPSADDRERIRRRVYVAAGIAAASLPIQASAASAAAAASTSAVGGSAAAGGLSALKVLVGTLAAVGVAGGGYTVVKTVTQEPAPSPPPIHERTRSGHHDPVTPTAPHMRADTVPDTVLAEPQTSVEPQTSAGPTTAAEPPMPPPPRRDATEPLLVTSAAEPTSEAPEPRLDSAQPIDGPTSVSDVGPDSAGPEREQRLRRELALLDRARAANDACKTTRALSLLGRYDLEHPDGQLAHEAEFLRVIVLCRAGEGGLARAHAMSFRKRWPASPLKARVGRVCQLPEAKEVCHDGE